MVKSTRIRLVYPCQYPIKVSFSFGSVKNIYIFINSYVPQKMHIYFPCICFPLKSPVFTDVSFPPFSASDNSEYQDASPNSYNDPPREPGSPFFWLNAEITELLIECVHWLLLIRNGLTIRNVSSIRLVLDTQHRFCSFCFGWVLRRYIYIIHIHIYILHIY